MKLIVLGILACITTAHGLKCYHCSGSETDCEKEKLAGDKAKYGLDCPLGMCMRAWAKKDDVTAVANTCTNEAGCNLAKEACDKSDEGKCAVACCDEDYCNAATSVSFSLMLMIVCSLIGLAFQK